MRKEVYMEEDYERELVFLFEEAVVKPLQKIAQDMKDKIDLADSLSGAPFRGGAERRGKFTVFKSWLKVL